MEQPSFPEFWLQASEEPAWPHFDNDGRYRDSPRDHHSDRVNLEARRIAARATKVTPTAVSTYVFGPCRLPGAHGSACACLGIAMTTTGAPAPTSLVSVTATTTITTTVTVATLAECATGGSCATYQCPLQRVYLVQVRDGRCQQQLLLGR
ncbi:hypothetical protein BJX66DRAFT_345802 [Aspergillus keveii]|uniref:Uncharacterized protein n=1 Tax=Aspergillus keveii TaxID=714993 RepID=A0ABR4FGV0_9EURO